MKRNRCLEKVSSNELDPLTNHILAKMGSKGAGIRRRLQHLIKERNAPRPVGSQEPSLKP